MLPIDPDSLHLWRLITRLGEAQILLPAALLLAWVLVRRLDARPLALRWLAWLGAAVLVTTATKVAFIGWGIGSPALNFTGISGHAMFAASVYPLLLGALASRAPRAGRQAAVAAGCALALLVGLSRLVLGAHSVSEVLAGLLLGGAVSAAALGLIRLPQGLIGPAVPAVIALWLALTPAHAPASQTHSAVTRLSLLLSGHKAPYTRSEMLREYRRRQTAPRDPHTDAA
jgi:membrane-associated phospholipid phosphatase